MRASGRRRRPTAAEVSFEGFGEDAVSCGGNGVLQARRRQRRPTSSEEAEASCEGTNGGGGITGRNGELGMVVWDWE